MSTKIFISAGHGGSDPGALSIDGKYKEKDINLGIALHLKAELDRHGIETKISRTDDTRITVDKYAKMSNDYGADYAIDIHNNASTSINANGSEVFHSVNGGKGQTLAANIQEELVAIGKNDRGIKTRKRSDGKDYYGFIRNTSAPAVIVECGFITNTMDLNSMITSEKQKVIAIAIAKGVLKTVGVTYIPEVVKVEEQTIAYRVQMGVFKNRHNAQDIVDRLTRAGFKPAIVPIKTIK